MFFLKMDVKTQDVPYKEDYFEVEIPSHLFEYFNSNSFKLQNLCRTCLSVNESEMFPVAPSHDSEHDDTLPEVFSSFTAIQVLPNDGLPPNICEVCKVQLINSFEFRAKCIKTNLLLKSIFTADFHAKEETFDKVEPKANLNDIKEENDDSNENVQYLEDISDSETLSLLQNAQKNIKNEVNGITTTESDLLLKEIIKKKKSNVCTFCSKRCPNKKALDKHIERNHSNANDPHACTQCKETFKSDEHLKLHMPLHGKGPVWTCVQCNKEFKARVLLRRHVSRHISARRWACSWCGKRFLEQYALRRHLATHTGQRPEKKHKCPFCDKRYLEPRQLSVHVSRHSGHRPCVCAECGKAFASTRLLLSHRRVHDEDDKRHQCQYCDKKFRHESTRNTHHRTHTGEKPYVCSVCGKTFIQNSNLTLHMRTHTGERPYSCEECGRAFSAGSTLKAHMRTHTGEKPYGCDICGKRFARVDLRAHRRQHTGERPFACTLCSRAFATKTRLNEHARLHTGEKPFECALCSQKFATKAHLTKHLKSHEAKAKKDQRNILIVPHNKSGETNTYTTIQHNDNVETNTYTTDETENQLSIVAASEVPMEITEEFIVPEEDAQSEILIVDDTQSSFQNGALCLTTAEDGAYSNDMNVVSVNEDEVSVLEGTTVKLYQLDQSLVQIHSSAGQLTISKITSKMTANF